MGIASNLALVIILLLLALGPSPGHGRNQSCPPFSCGQLHDLTYPFRLKDYPASCGEPYYELSCEGDKAIMQINGGTFYVTQVLSQDYTLRLVDANLSNSSTCFLPSPSLSISKIDTFGDVPSLIPTGLWVSFMNCSKPLKNNDGSYLALPCLSQGNSSVYVKVDSTSVGSLQPSCRYLAMSTLDVGDPTMINSERNLFRILQKGSLFNMGVPFGTGWKATRRCLTIEFSLFLNQIRGSRISEFFPSLARSEFYFINCVWGYSGVRIMVFVAALLGIMQLLILWVVLSKLLVSPFIVHLYLGLVLWNSRIKTDSVERFLRIQQRFSPTRYAYVDLVAITKNFKEKLGQGGFGSVYKGELLGGTLVAVKMLSNSKHNGEEFMSEVSTIGRIHHVNVVKLVGFCAEGSKRALIYEYMANSSLDKLIFSSKGTNNIHHTCSSEKLIYIALGIAHGIDYLHRGCEMQILHFDIKPHNILLDHNFTPKIADFGLAKLYPKDKSLVSMSAARGTIGYIAPELISKSFGAISYKSDVYSFGMLLLEMAAGRRNADRSAENSSKVYYPSWIYDKLERHSEQGGVDTAMAINEIEKKLSIVGLWCIQLNPAERPTMSKVIEMLEEADTDTLLIPRKPFFSSMEPIPKQHSRSSSSFSDFSIIP